MYHYFQALTNKSGDSLVGYFARVIDTTTGAVMTLASDANGTPVATVSGVADMATTDNAGNLSFFVEPGTYHLDIYGTDATTYYLRVPSVPMGGGTDSAAVSFLQAGTGAVTRTTQDKLRDWVTLSDFGVTGNLAVNETTKVQAAFDYAIATSKHLLIDLPARVSHIDINGANGLCVIQRAPIYGLTTGSYDSVITIRNSSDITWAGRLWISAAYNTGYTCAFAAYTDNASSATNLSIQDFAIVGAKLAFRFGRSTETAAQISEISVQGGYTYGCPNVVEAWGTQTFVSFVGSNLLSSDFGGDAGWQAITQTTVLAAGGNVSIVGGEVQHGQQTTGACFRLQPVQNATYGNLYGSIRVANAAIETAAALLVATNPNSGTYTAAAGSGRFALSTCFGYHSQDSFAFIQTAADYTGAVVVDDTCDFRCGVSRTNATATFAGSVVAKISDLAFGTGFIPGLKGLTGGIAKFGPRNILIARNCSSQALTASTPTILKWQSLTNNEDTTRFAANYSTSTGVFTVPTGGLKSIVVHGAIRTDHPLVQMSLQAFVNGTLAAASTIPANASGDGVVTATFNLGDLSAGDTIDLRALTASASVVTNYGTNEYMIVSASR
jgi:hypothetical protein